MGIPVTAAFHCQPENITYNIKLNALGFLNTFIYFWFRVTFYRWIKHIHCPSSFLAGELKRRHYQGCLHIISNGVSGNFRPRETPQERKDDRIHVLMIGRLAPEKRQDLIIKAVKHSKYRDQIQLYFAGAGPAKKRYIRMSADLPNPPVFEFLPQDKLIHLIYDTDIYVHASDVEIEGISCIEAFSCGKVPIISDSKKSAASQFAIDSRSLFKRGDYLDLRDKIDYWIEHPDEREQMGREYAKQGKELYNIDSSVEKLELMFQDAIRDAACGRPG
jgi:glycosyltransferase involved in cell wall biosynthesis